MNKKSRAKYLAANRGTLYKYFPCGQGEILRRQSIIDTNKEWLDKYGKHVTTFAHRVFLEWRNRVRKINYSLYLIQRKNMLGF